MLNDLRFAVRSLLRTPGFTLIVMLTLALGIGATTTIFSVINAVLLRPLPYQEPSQLVTILHTGAYPVAPANYLDWRDQSRSFEAMGAAELWPSNLTGGDQPERVLGLRVTQNLLPMFGVAPLLGRTFAGGEDQKGAEHEVVLGHGLWQRRFASDPEIIGKTIKLDGESYSVIGVMPRQFKPPPFWAPRAEFWAPVAFGERVQDRIGKSERVFARLKPGVTLAQARAEMGAITARLEQQYPGTNMNVAVTPLLEQVVGEIKTPLLILLGAVGFVLLIVCANVAHMLLARSAARQKELAVRMALGAPRSRLIRQLLTEGVLLALVGGAIGLLLGIWGMKILVTLGPTNIPRLDMVSLDGQVTLFVLGITLLTGVGFSLAPALQSSGVGLNDRLKEAGRGSGDGVRRHRLRSVLIASEFSLALTLLVGAGLMIRSFFKLQSVDPGFNPQHVLSMVVSVAGSNADTAGSREIFYRQLLERIRTLPGVESAGAINHLPLAGDTWGRALMIEGRPVPRPGEAPGAIYRIATPDYFRAMQMRLLRGRDFSDRDTTASPAVVVINERASLEYWPNENPLGKRIAVLGTANDPIIWSTIIGVVKNAKQQDWAAKPYPEIYLAAFQNAEFLGMSQSFIVKMYSYITLVVRAAGDPSALTTSIKNTVWSFDRNLTLSDIVTLEDVVERANAQPRFQMLLLGVFAFVALTLAAIGIYGVMSYAVSRRTRELGVRISLGASQRDVLRLVIGQGMMLALVGSAVGILAALLLSRLMAQLLYGVTATDPMTFVAVTLTLLIVALLACYLPARRATKVDPLVALRTE